jgi:hypothetical protein
MRNKVNEWMRRARLRLAAKITPPGAEVHDHQARLCDCWEGLLELVQFGRLRVGAGGRLIGPVDGMIEDMYLLGAVELDDAGGCELTVWGMRELARMWGPDTVPPWGRAWLACTEHGIREAGPGEPLRCPECPLETPAQPARPWWSWMIPGRMSRYPL